MRCRYSSSAITPAGCSVEGEEPFRTLTTTRPHDLGNFTSPHHECSDITTDRLASVPVSLVCAAIGTPAIYRAVLVTQLLQRLPARAAAETWKLKVVGHRHQAFTSQLPLRRKVSCSSNPHLPPTNHRRAFCQDGLGVNRSGVRSLPYAALATSPDPVDHRTSPSRHKPLQP